MARIIDTGTRQSSRQNPRREPAASRLL